MLNEIFSPERIKLNLEGKTKEDVFKELIGTIAGPDTEFDYRELLEAVKQRESKMDTIILPGIAMPHGYCPAVNGIIGAIGFSQPGIEYNNMDQNPVHLFFLLLMDESSREQHLQVLSRLMALLNSTAITGIRGMETPRELYDLLCRY